MSDLDQYSEAQTERKRAYAAYNHASCDLNLAQIKERMAELHSQYEPLNTLTEGNREEREHILQAVFYVVVGRFLEGKTA